MTSSNDISPGMSHSVSAAVNETNTAHTVGSGGLAVLATPSMIAMMERAAYECVEKSMNDGQTTVGSMISIEHLAASPVGAQITATATVETADGRKIDFKISARDGHGEIGSGTHTRFIVDKERFMSKAQARV
ncbi:MAG: thioesterase family protein [Defluviitaleaceae bacterium]|nr:thioesterase family protein [Defluviitaleaceae bacterium]